MVAEYCIREFEFVIYWFEWRYIVVTMVTSFCYYIYNTHSFLYEH